jgi:hypothetical protein
MPTGRSSAIRAERAIWALRMAPWTALQCCWLILQRFAESFSVIASFS